MKNIILLLCIALTVVGCGKRDKGRVVVARKIHHRDHRLGNGG